ncbi:MAG: thermonuclease family protein [Rhodobacterales bacterium]|nr:thermonuclease family protein [Rhodobacterales bacterium]MDX5411755.1 thermonuclease family protein [Rhodobacterales bacterium]
MYTYRAIVRRIVDGDTVDCDVDMGFRAWRMNERFRLAGVNTPEMRGPDRDAGRAAKAFVESLIAPGAEIIIETAKDPDSFGRWIATVYINNQSLNDALVDHGHAVRKSY